MSLIHKQLFDAVAGDTLCILALIFVCAKPSMMCSKLVLFEMHEMMRKLQKVLGHFLLPLALICSCVDALSPRKD